MTSTGNVSLNDLVDSTKLIHTHRSDVWIRSRLPALCTVAIGVILASLQVTARDRTAPPPDPTADPVLIAAGFLDHHPDLRYRMRGLDAYGAEDHSKAFRLFKRAAFFGDKASQAIVGEMYWIGLGIEKDRALAHVWMDLAAERGYLSFVRKRDFYLSQLDPYERERSLAMAPEIRADYADEATTPRIGAALRLGRAQMTGSRVGAQSNSVQIFVPGYGTIDSSRFYDPQYWDPKQYRAWHDAYWMDLRIGTVEVGDAEPVKAPDTTPTEQDKPPE